jgi:hypothetical protein
MGTENLIPADVAARLANLVALPRFLEKARVHFSVPDNWKRIGDQGFWRRIVSQVCVVGSSAGWERISKSSEMDSTLRFSRLLAKRPGSRRRVIHGVLRRHGVRYVTLDPERCRKTAALVRNLEFLESFPDRAKGYLKLLAAEPSERVRVKHVSRHLAYIKNKGARDLLIELDLGRSLITLDVRSLNVLKWAGAKLPVKVQSNPAQYEALESAVLREVCARVGLTGAEVDRIIYWNYEELKTELGGRRLTGRCRRRPKAGRA